MQPVSALPKAPGVLPPTINFLPGLQQFAKKIPIPPVSSFLNIPAFFALHPGLGHLTPPTPEEKADRKAKAVEAFMKAHRKLRFGFAF